MILDTSALMAILLNEPEAAAFTLAIAAAPQRSISAASLTEAMMVIAQRKGAPGVAALRRLLREAAITVVPVDEKAALEAFDAWARFGKGNHPARLNYGDCFSYAAASLSDQPLLFKGDDFAQTDILAAL
jgi:ribonuclease VapC